MSTHVVPVIEIKEVHPHPNADRLDLVTVNGWTCAVKKGDFKPGDLAVYIEPDFLVPVTRPEFAFLKDPSKFDQTHVRIKAMRLRGVMSFGLLIPAPPGKVFTVDGTVVENIEPGANMMDFYGITRWQPPEAAPMRTGFAMANSTVPAHIRNVSKFDLENINNYPNLIDLGNEEVVITEKIHGANARYAFADGQFFAGSRSQWLRRPLPEEIDQGHKLDAWNRTSDKFPAIEAWCRTFQDVILYGEIFGNVQDLKYGRPNAVDFAGFAAYDTRQGEWIDTLQLFATLRAFEVMHAPVLVVGPMDKRDIEYAAELDSSVPGTPDGHMSEGVVITPTKERRDPRHGRVSLKYVSNRYWTRKL